MQLSSTTMRKFCRSFVLRQNAALLSYLSPLEEFPARAFPTMPLTPNRIVSEKVEGGATIITNDANSPVINLKFALLGGSSTEVSSQKGAAQFLASAAFEGNKKNSGLRMVRFLESLGAQFTAQADREKITYNVSVLQDRVEPVIAAIVAAISSPPHAPYVLEESRKNALLHFEKSYSCRNFALNELLHEAAFGEGSAYGNPLFGNDLSKLKVEDVLEYRKSHFVQENLVVCGSGISSDRLKALLQLYIKHIPSSKGVVPVLPNFSYVGGELKVRDQEKKSTSLALAFPVPSGSSIQASQIFTSSLTDALRVKNICAEALTVPYSNGALFTIRVHGSANSASTNLNRTLETVKDLSASSDFTLAKKKLSLDYQLQMEASKDSTNLFLDAYLRSTSSPLNSHFELSQNEIDSSIKTILKSAPSYAVYGTTEGVPSLTSIKSFLV